MHKKEVGLNQEQKEAYRASSLTEMLKSRIMLT